MFSAVDWGGPLGGVSRLCRVTDEGDGREDEAFVRLTAQVAHQMSLRDVRERLADRGMILQTGPYRYRLRSNVPQVAEHLIRFYAGGPLREDAEFCDFHVYLRKSRGLHPPFGKMAVFGLEGGFQLKPFRREQAAAYLEWGLNRCIYGPPNARLLIHAATLEKKGNAIILVGDAGAGKSTLCAGLAQNGWRLLSDELAILSLETGELATVTRPIILKNDSIRLIRDRDDGTAVFGPEIAATPKGTVAHARPNPAPGMPGETPPNVFPRWFLFVNFAPRARLELTPTPKGQSMLRIARFTFNYGLLGRRGFEALASAVDRAECHDLSHGDLEEVVSFLDSAGFSGHAPRAGSGPGNRGNRRQDLSAGEPIKHGE